MDLIRKYQDVILYVFFGVCTTIVNIISYGSLAYWLRLPMMVCTIVAWLVAVLFAFFTNRKWVFKSDKIGFGAIIREMLVKSFFVCKLPLGVFIFKQPIVLVVLLLFL
jgi:putative flippase GtrA